MQIYEKSFSGSKFSGGGISLDVDLDPQHGTPPGRLPIGDSGFYKTPDVISPFDKDNYPDSPFNGGNPFSRDPIAADVTVNLHPCGVDIDAQGTIGFIKLPVHGFSYRFPGECRLDPPDIIPPSPVSGVDENYQPQPTVVPQGFADSDEVILVVLFRSIDFAIAWDGEKQEYYTDAYFNHGVVTGVEFPSREILNQPGYSKVPAFVSVSVDRDSYLLDVNSPARIHIHPDLPNDSGKSYRSVSSFQGNDGNPIFTLYHGRFRNIVNNIGKSYRHFNQYQTTLPSGRIITETYLSVGEFFIVYCQKIAVLNDPYKNNPPEPDDFRDKKDCCMSCCSQSNRDKNEDSDLLKEILRRVKKVERRTWDGDTDVKMPESLRQETNWLSSVLPPPQVTLTNLPQLNAHIFKLFEEVIGQWDLNIQIKDVDPATPGDQPKGMKVPAISEAFGEVLGTTIQSTINTEVLINMMSRCMYEIGVNRQATMDANYSVRALIDYFGFKTVEAEEKMPMAFTPGKDRIEDTLKEYEHTLQVTRFDDEKNSYKSDMAKVLQMVARWNAQNYKKVNTSTVEAGVGEIVKRIKDLREAQAKQDEVGAKKLQEDFDTWVERYERGFTDIPNIDDSINPFGEPLDQRPRVIRLDKQSGNDNTTT